MQELINKLISEVGLSAEQAQKTVTTCLTFVKSKLPSSLAGNVDAMFSGAQGEEPKHESISDKASDFAHDAKEKLGDMAHDAKEKLDQLLGGDAKEKLEDLAGDAKEKLEDLAEGAKDALGKLKGLFGGNKDKA